MSCSGRTAIVAAPSAMSTDATTNAGTRPVYCPTSPQTRAPTACPPMNTICCTDSPRARTHPGRKTWVAAPRVESTASQAAPAGSRRTTTSGEAVDQDDAELRGGVDEAGEEHHEAGGQPLGHPGQDDGSGDRADAERGEEEAVATGSEAQPLGGDQWKQGPQGRARQHEQRRAQQQPAHHLGVPDVAGPGPQRGDEPLRDVAGHAARADPTAAARPPSPRRTPR